MFAHSLVIVTTHEWTNTCCIVMVPACMADRSSWSGSVMTKVHCQKGTVWSDFCYEHFAVFTGSVLGSSLLNPSAAECFHFVVSCVSAVGCYSMSDWLRFCMNGRYGEQRKGFYSFMLVFTSVLADWYISFRRKQGSNPFCANTTSHHRS